MRMMCDTTYGGMGGMIMILYTIYMVGWVEI